MNHHEFKSVARLLKEQADAERRKAHYEDRLTELMRPRANEAARQRFIDRVAEDLNDVMRELAALHRKIGEAQG